MNFKQAFEAMKHGVKVKLPSWGGYWCWDKEKQTIMMHCRPQDVDKGQWPVLDIRETQRVEYTLQNILSDDWQIANEDNTPVLGGVATFGFDVALKYIKRGLKVKRKSWGNNVYVYVETQDVKIYEGKETSYMALAMCASRENKKYYDIGWKPSQYDLFAEDWMFAE